MNFMISPAEIRYLREIAHTRNLSRAAERLGITQPALTQALRRAETTLGLELFYRSKTGAVPTKAGERFLGEAELLLAQWQRMTAAARSAEEEVAGQFRIGCHPSVGVFSFPHFLPALQRAHPALDIQLVHGPSRHITAEVVCWRLDFGIVINPVRHPDLVIHELGLDTVTFFRSPGKYNADVLLLQPDLQQSQTLVTKAEKQGLRFARTVESTSFETLLAVAEAGGGAVILPERVVRSGRQILKRLSPNAPEVQDRLCLVYRADIRSSAAAKAIIDSIRKAAI